MSFPTYQDDFEAGVLDTKKWRDRQIEPRQISFATDSASGKKSIVVSVTDGDGGLSCSTPCQRAEIRTHGGLRPRHKDEFWHGFSIRASGDIPTSGSLRTVLGQWKAPGDESPFLAQRFDNGVFHVTVQDGPNRRTVASAEGDPDRLESFQDLIAQLSGSAPGVVEAARSFAELKRMSGAVAPEALMDGGQKHFGLLSTAAKQLAGLDSDETEDLFEEFAYIQELEAYSMKPALSVTRVDDENLPDPKQDWVRMAYRIKPGRTDNDPNFGPRREGEIDIYADGKLFAEVRGSIGYQLTEQWPDDTVYFKFGVYRNLTTGTLNLHFDDFRQGSKASDVL